MFTVRFEEHACIEYSKVWYNGRKADINNGDNGHTLPCLMEGEGSTVLTSAG